MWLIILILAVLFGYQLAKKEEISLVSWIIAFLAALIIGWIFGLILTSILPSLSAFTLSADVQLTGYIILDIIGLIIGLVAAKAEEAVIK